MLGRAMLMAASNSAAAAWTPAQITTALWLDANDAATITTVSGAVSQWNDKSGNGRHLSQPTAASRPAYQATGLNSLPTLSFDGINDFLQNTSFSFGNSALTFYCVMQSSLPSGGLGCVFIASPVPSNANQASEFLYGNAVSGYQTITFKSPAINSSTSTPQIGASTTHLTTAQIVSTGYDGGGSSPSNHVFSVNGSALTSTTSGPILFNNSEAGFSIGMRPLQGNVPFNGRISEIVFCASLLSSTTRQQVEGYLAWKWGLVTSLPAGHPYKSAAPTA